MLTLFKRQDWILNGAVFFLMGASLLMLASLPAGRQGLPATRQAGSGSLFKAELAWVILSVLLIFLFSEIDWRALITYRWIIIAIYLFSLALLVFTYFFAPVIRNTRSWLVLGPIRFQVAEFVKAAMIIFFSYYFARRHIGIAHLKNIVLSFLYIALPAGFVFLQPDMGTMLVLLGLWIGFLLVSGLRWKHIGIGLAILALILFFGWHSVLKDYQRARIIGLFQPSYDPLGVNYNTIQSKIAIGSAGFFGKGFRQGTQVQLGFLPEAGTDFIFSAFIEEWGLLGGLLILVAFFVMLFRIIRIGLRAENNFSRFICLGAGIMFLIHFILNTGSAIGLLPVIGLTFPFFSYGGSSLIVSAALVGIIQSSVAHQSLR